MSSILAYVVARLKEASTWAAISAILAGLHVTLPAGLFDQITSVGMALAGLAAFLIPNTGSISVQAPPNRDLADRRNHGHGRRGILAAVIALARRDGATQARIDQADQTRTAAERIADAEARAPRDAATLAQRLRDGGQL